MSIFEELKRRNVFRVGIAYAVAAWLILQLTEVLSELLELDTDIGKIVILLLVVGFVPALIFAWAFELTPEGIKRDKEVDRSRSVVHQTGRRLDFWIIGMLVLALGYFVWDEVRDLATGAGAEPISATAEESTPQAQPAPGETAAATPADETSIAVLPFADLSAEGDQEYFADGISEELLNLLVRVEGLKVASRTSSFAYKDSSLGIADIARDLKVDHVLEGSVRKAENRVRITAQLIDTGTDRHLWSETFDRELDDIFAIQDEIANAIVGALRSELGVLETAAPIQVRQDTENLDAYQSYLVGRSLFKARRDLPRSIELLERSVELDPAFARGWESLSAVYGVVESWGITGRPYSDLALDAARQALELDPGLSMPYAVLGLVEGMDLGRGLDGLRQLDQAIENDPLNATAWHWRGNLWLSFGFPERGVDDMLRCLEIDPEYLNCRRHLGLGYLTLNDDDRAFEAFSETAEHGYPGSEVVIASLLMRRGNRIAAALTLWNWRNIDNDYPVSDLLDAMEDRDGDQRDRLVRYLDWLDRTKNPSDMQHAELALLGAYERIGSLNASPSASWVWLPEFAGFRASSYFKPFIESYGMPEFWRSMGFPDLCRPVGEEDFECE